MNKFLIVAEIRSGYKWLSSLISSHPQAFCFGEIFGSDEKIRQISLFNKPIKAIKEKEDPKKWIKNNLEKWAQSQNLMACGFKMNYVDGEYNIHWNNLWKYIQEEEYKVIHLTRKNLIDRSLSELLAVKEKNWSDKNYQSKIHVDPYCLMKMIARSELWQESLRKKFKNLFEIHYEDIPYKLDDLQEFLGLPIKKLTTFHKKQRTKKQCDYIENYKEIEKMIKNHFPKFRKMLDIKEIKM